VVEWHKRRLLKGDKTIREDLRLLLETNRFGFLKRAEAKSAQFGGFRRNLQQNVPFAARH
jgi:hypothetical protein